MADFSVDHAQISQTGDTMFAGYLNPEQAEDYFAEAEKVSVVQPPRPQDPHGHHWREDPALDRRRFGVLAR